MVLQDIRLHVLEFSNAAKGKVHDFQLFKSSKIHSKLGIQLTADSGYQEPTNKVACELHFAERIYQKQSRIEADREQNKNISIKCIAIEHVIALVKRFRILLERYRYLKTFFSTFFFDRWYLQF